MDASLNTVLGSPMMPDRTIPLVSKSGETIRHKSFDQENRSFQITFYCLVFAVAVTFLVGLSVGIPAERNILYMESFIAAVAAIIYYLFLQQNQTTESASKPHIDWSAIAKLRYLDWAITTPIMLVVLCLVLSLRTKIPLTTGTAVSLVGLDWLMLVFGYLGEVGVLSKIAATILGFLPFLVVFYIIYTTFLTSRYVRGPCYALFGLYFVIWAAYGVVYLLDEVTKNMIFNGLDAVAKAFVGVALSVAYSV
jgi:bacteriorhodopsin